MTSRSVLATLALATLALIAAFAVTHQVSAIGQGDPRLYVVAWKDANCDGIRQDGEPELPNMTLTLRWAGANGTIDATDNDVEEMGSLTGTYPFWLPGAGEPYFISFRSEDKPQGMYLAPFRAGDDPTRDNDMTMPLAGTTLWATPVFTMPLDGSVVTGQDIGLCKYPYAVSLPLVVR
ncbi:hypothetical protein EKD04_017870 [Chloroflexales bacterium ZM16-3]|nr:hypothetical protein [Chloroflexales bacterium ZM16-3]